MQSAVSERARRNMVDSQLRPNGVNAPWIVAALLRTPREQHVPPSQQAAAYSDRPVPLGHGRLLSPPLAAGLQLLFADVRTADRVMVIGAATGYLAALLAHQAAAVVAVEESPALAEALRANVTGITVVEAPLALGATDHGPFDLIIIDGAIEELPQAIADQLADGGRVITGLREGAVVRLAGAVKRGPHLALRSLADVEVASIPGFARAAEFVF